VKAILVMVNKLSLQDVDQLIRIEFLTSSFREIFRFKTQFPGVKMLDAHVAATVAKMASLAAMVIFTHSSFHTT